MKNNINVSSSNFTTELKGVGAGGQEEMRRCERQSLQKAAKKGQSRKVLWQEGAKANTEHKRNI